MNGLLWEDVIQSINFDQHEILKDIIQLHCPNGFDVDPTFRTGGFYKAGVPVPRYCFDLEPRDPRCKQSDCRSLPLEDDSVESIIFDPPFLAAGGKKGRMHQEYGTFDSIGEMESMYKESLVEFKRILRPQGILVFKCQDFVNGRQQHFLHVLVNQWAVERGFISVDLFIKLNKSAMIPANYTTQRVARKMHSYFWVFKSSGRRKRSYPAIEESE